MSYRQIGMRLRKRRLELKQTQEEVAEAAEISLSFYGHIERGTRKLSLETFLKLISVLNCSADSVLGTGFAEEKHASALELLALAQRLAEESGKYKSVPFGTLFAFQRAVEDNSEAMKSCRRCRVCR